MPKADARIHTIETFDLEELDPKPYLKRSGGAITTVGRTPAKSTYVTIKIVNADPKGRNDNRNFVMQDKDMVPFARHLLQMCGYNVTLTKKRKG